MVKVVMPAKADRRSVDLYLCGHHYRESRDALRAAGAAVHDARDGVDVPPNLAESAAAI